MQANPEEHQSVWANGKLRLIVTPKCNLKCFYCHNEGQPRTGEEMMAPSDLEHLVDWAINRDDKPTSVTFSGGEATLHPNLHSLVALASSLSPSVTLVTNGVALDVASIEVLATCGLTRIRVGIDSLDPYKPRPSHGRLSEPFHVEKLISACRELGVGVEFNTVLSRFNEESFHSILEMAIDLGVPTKFFEMVHVESFGTTGSLGSMTPLPQVPVAKFMDAFARLSHESLEPDRSIYGESNMVANVAGTEIRYCRFLCPYGLCWTSGTRIDAQGTIYTCMNNRGELGFRESWGPELVDLQWRCR